jgi:hypothetical protein
MSQHDPYQNGLLLTSRPEFILVDEEGNQVDAVELLGQGKKTAPKHAANISIMIEDGKLIFNPPPASCRAYAQDYIFKSLKVALVNLKKKAFLSNKKVIEHDGHTFYAGGRILIASRATVYNYGGQAGGKNLKKAIEKHPAQIIRTLDMIVGTLCTILDQSEGNIARRKLYPAGSYSRIKADGQNYLSYDVPSNFWMHSPALMHLIYGATRACVYFVMNDIDFCGKFPIEFVVSAINNCDVDKAKIVWRWVRNELPNKYGLKNTQNPFSDDCLKVIDAMVVNGLDVLGDELYKNWKLKKRAKNYVGHIGTLPGWESGALSLLHRWEKKQKNQTVTDETEEMTTEELITDE